MMLPGGGFANPGSELRGDARRTGPAATIDLYCAA